MVHKIIDWACLYVVKFKYRKWNQNVFHVKTGLHIIIHDFQNSKHQSFFPTIKYLAVYLAVTYMSMNVLGNALNKFQQQINPLSIINVANTLVLTV